MHKSFFSLLIALLICFVLVGCMPEPANEGNQTIAVPTFYGNNTKTITIPGKLAELCYSWYAPAITGFKTIDRKDLSSYKPVFLGEAMTISIAAETDASLTLKGASDNFGFTLVLDKKNNTFSYFQSFFGRYANNPSSTYLGIAFSDAMTITKEGIIKGDIQYQFFSGDGFGTGCGEFFASPLCSGIAIYKVTADSESVELIFENASLEVESNEDAMDAYTLMKDFYTGKEASFTEKRYLAYIKDGAIADVGDMGPTVTPKSDIESAINTLDSRWVLAH